MSAKFISWYKNGSTKRFDTKEDVVNDENFELYTETVTEEIYVDDKYIGEVDYSWEEFLENFY